MVKPDSTVADKNERKGKGKQNKKMYSQGYFYKNRLDSNTHYNNPYIYNAYQSTYNSNFMRPKHFHTKNFNSYKFDRRRQQPYPKKVDKEKSPPLKGSEEYTLKKIEETSKLIMQAILNPQECTSTSQPASSQSNSEQETADSQPVPDILSSDKSSAAAKKTPSKPKKMSSLEQKVLHDKIMNHITNLKDSRKKNLINSGSSEYDAFIQQIQKQKRLEISRALRDMAGQDDSGSSSFFNSVIPDIGVELTDLPKELIDQLQMNLGISLDTNDVEFNFPWPSELDDFSAGQDVKFDLSTLESSESEQKNSDVSIIESIKSEDNVSDSSIIESTESEHIHSELQSTECEIKQEILDIPDIKKSPLRQTEETNLVDMRSVVTSNPNFTQETRLTPLNEQYKCSIRDSSKFFNPNFKKKRKVLSRDPSFVSPKQIDNLTDQLLLGSKKGVSTDSYTSEYDNAPDQDIIIFEEDSVQSLSMSSPSKSATNTSKQCTFPAQSEQFVYFNVNEPCGKNNSQVDSSQCLQVTFADDSLKEKSRNEKVQVHPNSLKEGAPPPTVSLFHNIPEEIESENSLLRTKTSSTQTISDKTFTFTELLKNFIKCKSYPTCLNKAIDVVSDIDEAVAILAKYRKEMLLKLHATDDSRRIKKRDQRKRKKEAKKNKKNTSISVQEIIARSDDTFELKTTDSDNLLPKDTTLNHFQSTLSLSEIHQLNNHKILQFKDVSEKMLVVQCIADRIVAASESGNMFSFSCDSGDLVHQVKVASNPITSICSYLNVQNHTYDLYVSSIDSLIRIYNMETLDFAKSVDVGDGLRIQCMEQSWGFIFIGSSFGMLKRYNIANARVEYSDQLEKYPIFAIKATKEGARRVLLVGTRNEEVAVRDAVSGLLLRRLGGQESTVYSIVIRNSLVYCGTTNKNILVYSFHEGNLIKEYYETNCKGISSMKVERNLLFASSFNGSIYIYNLNTDKLAGSLDGPGGVILCMEIYKNQIIIGTMKFQFVSIPIPFDILKEFFS